MYMPAVFRYTHTHQLCPPGGVVYMYMLVRMHGVQRHPYHPPPYVSCATGSQQCSACPHCVGKPHVGTPHAHLCAEAWALPTAGHPCPPLGTPHARGLRGPPPQRASPSGTPPGPCHLCVAVCSAPAHPPTKDAAQDLCDDAPPGRRQGARPSAAAAAFGACPLSVSATGYTDFGTSPTTCLVPTDYVKDFVF